MIKKITLINFQSHSETHIVLNDNMTVIIGASDSGKSAIRRAVQALSRKSPFYLRYGTDEGRVTIEFDDCIVSRVYKRVKTTKCPACKEPLGDNKRVCGECGTLIPDKPAADYYMVDDQKFDKFGMQLPPMIAEKIRICDVMFGDLAVNINIQTQFEDMFFIGNTFNGSNRNKLISGLVPDSEKVDVAIKEMSSEKNDRRNEIKFMEKEIEENTIKIDLLKKDMLELEKMYAVIETCQKDIAEKTAQYEEMKGCADIINSMQNLERMGAFLIKHGDALTKAGEFVDKILQKAQVFDSINDANDALKKLRLDSVEIPTRVGIAFMGEILDQIQVQTERHNVVKQINDDLGNQKILDAKIPSLSKDQLEKILSKMEAFQIDNNSLQGSKAELQASDQLCVRLKNEESQLKKDKTSIQESFKSEHGSLICPHRGDVYADECLEKFCK